MKLDRVIPFGRSLGEYRAMFRLSESELDKSILGVADGPASFNAEMFAQGRRVVSVDPVYQFSADDIESRFHEVVDNVIAQVRATPDDWIWGYHASPEDLRESRVATVRQFVADFPIGKPLGRYVVGELPRLNWDDGSFDLALCSHFLFLYSDHFSCDFHLESIVEMLRVAREVRIFPLVTLAARPSTYVPEVIHQLALRGYNATVEKSTYELQRGGNQMLRVV